jgi:hypothetical protein
VTIAAFSNLNHYPEKIEGRPFQAKSWPYDRLYRRAPEEQADAQLEQERQQAG